MTIPKGKPFKLGSETYYLSWGELTFKPIVLDSDGNKIDKGKMGKEKFDSIVNACIELMRDELNYNSK